MNTHKQYVREVVWIPSYLVIVFFVLSTVQNSNVATLAMFIGLIACRMFLELLSRNVFGEQRLTVRIGLLIFVFQLVGWGALLIWYLHSSQKI